MENGFNSLKGHFLLAMPALQDPNFYQTVSLICEHNDNGAFGIVINRVHAHLSGKDIFDELEMDLVPSAESLPIHIGGPVHNGEIFLVHGPPFHWESCLMVTQNIAMSNTRDILEAIARGDGPTDLVLSLGCAGWGPGQLEGEIMENAWLTLPAIDELLFGWPVEQRWEESVKRLGVDPALLANTAGNA